MKFNYGRAILTFVVGFIISFIVGSSFNDAGIGIMTAICYVGAIIAGAHTTK